MSTTTLKTPAQSQPHSSTTGRLLRNTFTLLAMTYTAGPLEEAH